MRTVSRWSVSVPFLAVLLAGGVSAQHEGHGAPDAQKAPAAAAATRAGDVYPFATCPISGKEIGTMGDAVVKVYDGREVRFCCDGCPPKFEKDLAGNFAKLDTKIVGEQAPIYPLKTSLVTGKDLPTDAVEFVYGNRLVRVGAAEEKAVFLKEAARFLAVLDKAVIEAQGKNYPLKTCVVSGEELGGMGDALDRVVAGRLVRLCCKGCIKKLEKDPAKFIGLVDAARGAKGGACGGACGNGGGCCGAGGGEAAQPAKAEKGGCCEEGAKKPPKSEAGGCCEDGEKKPAKVEKGGCCGK